MLGADALRRTEIRIVNLGEVNDRRSGVNRGEIRTADAKRLGTEAAKSDGLPLQGRENLSAASCIEIRGKENVMKAYNPSFLPVDIASVAVDSSGCVEKFSAPLSAYFYHRRQLTNKAPGHINALGE